jgi:primosomal protein N' (replication factor Y)
MSRFVRVALDVPVGDWFDYEAGAVDVPAGSLVVVPFGRRRTVGVAIETVARSALAPERLRRIERRLEVDPLPPETLALARFCSEYYRAPLGQVLFAILPTALRRPAFRVPSRAWRYRLTALGRSIDVAVLPKRAVAARRLWLMLHSGEALTSTQVQAVSSRAAPWLRAWLEAGWIEREAALAGSETPSLHSEAPREPPALTDDQQQAVDRIAAAFGRYAPWLLEGITGSGKTEVYLQLAAQAFARAEQVLLLVPEINLTPQLESRLTARFPGLPLVSLHSGLNATERLARWTRASRGDARLVLGTRLAVFTPLPRLGLVIVDEEHDGSYKQQEGMRYHARDVAVLLARERQVPIVLGSATPSLETVLNARKGRFGRLTLSERPSAVLPSVYIVDTTQGTAAEPLPPSALIALERRLERREQSLVFINRRGYAPVLLCRACGWIAACPRCAARLTLHVQQRALRCHYCGHRADITVACPDCGNQDLRGLGHGTQRLEEWLVSRFPRARVLRVDSDTTRRKHSFERMRQAVHAESVDILVGTQMLAKGHDFPKLTLVIVVGADLMLFSTDFRAPERLYQQLAQVAGRAGRAHLPGEVLVLTQFPRHPLYQALRQHDFGGFAQLQLLERERTGFPPFIHQAMLRAEATSEKSVAAFLSTAAQAAAAIADGVEVYDPVPAPIARIAGRYRWQLLVQSHSRAALQRFLATWQARLRDGRSSSVRWALDVDPLEV